MPSDNRYYGIYRGKIISVDDPSGIGRVTLQVPQVFGTDVTTWAYPIIGVPANKKIPYGSWISTATQTTADSAVNNIIALDTTEDSYGIDLINPSTTTPATSAIKFKYAGVYNIQISSQLYTTIGGNGFLNVDMWMRQNGLDVSNSVGSISIGAKNPYAVSSWNYVVSVNSGDTLQWIWHVNTSISTSLTATAAQAGPPAQPETPSFAVSATLVSNYLPNSGDNAWVMFEGGDPNYPLWLGTF